MSKESDAPIKYNVPKLVEIPISFRNVALLGVIIWFELELLLMWGSRRLDLILLPWNPARVADLKLAYGL